MSYKQRLIDTFEVARDYFPILILYGTLLVVLLSNVLVIFFGRTDLEGMARSSARFLIGGLFGMRLFRS